MTPCALPGCHHPPTWDGRDEERVLSKLQLRAGGYASNSPQYLSPTMKGHTGPYR